MPALVKSTAPAPLDEYGVGADSAAVLLVTAGDNPGRLTIDRTREAHLALDDPLRRLRYLSSVLMAQHGHSVYWMQMRMLTLEVHARVQDLTSTVVRDEDGQRSEEFERNLERLDQACSEFNEHFKPVVTPLKPFRPLRAAISRRLRRYIEPIRMGRSGSSESTARLAHQANRAEIVITSAQKGILIAG